MIIYTVPNHLTKNSGFSLIEILLVVLVAGMIIAVLANLTPTINLLTTSNRENTARQIVAKRIEDIRAQGFDNLANGTDPFSDPRLTSLPQSGASTIIEDCPAQICVNSEPIKKVQIQVSWVENNQSKEFSATTLISKGGLR